MLKTGIIVSAFLLTFSSLAPKAHAYVARVTNATEGPVAVDLGGVAVIGGSMMRGKIRDAFDPKKKIWKKSVKQATTYYKNAGAVPLKQFSSVGKPIIEPGHTVVLEFTDIDLGICFDFSNVAVGVKNKGYSMRARDIKFADSASFGEVMDAVESMGPDISTVGEGVGQLGGKAKAAGTVLQGIGALWKNTVSAGKGSGCRNISMVIVKTDVSGSTETGLTLGEKLGVFVLR